MATTRLLNGAAGLVHDTGSLEIVKEKSSAGTQADGGGYYNGADIVSYEAALGIDHKVSADRAPPRPAATNASRARRPF